jgi:RNA-directed DNA polymerase
MRTLESRILRKASVRFGEGRTEKCPQRQLAGRLLYFVILATEPAEVEAAKTKLEGWLKERGLYLSEEKTRITHLSTGFDFLGFTIRQYRTSKKRRGAVLLTCPSKKAVAALKERLREEWRQLVGQSAETVIRKLNPICARLGQLLPEWRLQQGLPRD